MSSLTDFTRSEKPSREELNKDIDKKLEESVCEKAMKLIRSFRQIGKTESHTIATNNKTDPETPNMPKEWKEALLKPEIVHINMVRGTIAKLTDRQVKHLFPHLFENDNKNNR